jgi:hypothetical protein
MDYATAHLVEFKKLRVETVVIRATQIDKDKFLKSKDYSFQIKDENQQQNFYKTIAEHILNFKNVMIFGPCDAKIAFENCLKTDDRFDKVQIAILPADKMTDNQKHAFVNQYFKTTSDNTQ